MEKTRRICTTFFGKQWVKNIIRLQYTPPLKKIGNLNLLTSRARDGTGANNQPHQTKK
jgi:hypothetical protein